MFQNKSVAVHFTIAPCNIIVECRHIMAAVIRPIALLAVVLEVKLRKVKLPSLVYADTSTSSSVIPAQPRYSLQNCNKASASEEGNVRRD